MGITIVGLGPGNGRFLTREAWEFLAAAETVYLRTARHPAVADLPESVAARSALMLCMKRLRTLRPCTTQIVAELLSLGREADIVYAVPGHPFVGESTVTRLVAAAEDGWRAGCGGCRIEFCGAFVNGRSRRRTGWIANF